VTLTAIRRLAGNFFDGKERSAVDGDQHRDDDQSSDRSRRLRDHRGSELPRLGSHPDLSCRAALRVWTKVRLMAVPASGSYFFRWVNSAAGNLSPATLQLTNGNPGVAALFASLAGEQVSLVALVEGSGTLNGSPAANVFTNGQHITLTALPDADQVFLGWSGDVTAPSTRAAGHGRQQDRDRDFCRRGAVSRVAIGVRHERVLLTMKGVPGFVFDLQASADLASWNRLETLTNLNGILNYQHWAATNQPWLFYRVVAP